MLSLLLLSAVVAWAAPGPAGLADLQEGREVAGYAARALYLNASGEPAGARFLHKSGMPVDVLFFASVPQVSLYAKTPPGTDRGEPHTLEHLLLGKGRAGKAMQLLMQMRLGDQTAGTDSDMTFYQFHSAAGAEGFYEALDGYLTALLRPDFTDEEARREVANFEAEPGEGGRLKLEEKGTVYNEMTSSMEKADSVNYYRQVRHLLFGTGHPLARNQGGEPDQMWTMTPQDIRDFHRATYRVGPNMTLIAALPLSWDAADFLGRLDALLNRLDPEQAPRDYPGLPPFSPAPEGEVRIGGFPSEDAAPQGAVFAWPPRPGMTAEEELRLEVFLELLGGGETSYLYADLVDGKTRAVESGATTVWSWLEKGPGAYASVGVAGLPVASITPEALGRLREAVRTRIARLTSAAPGSDALKESATKARSLISSGRRARLKFMDSPPRFGQRHAGSAWHRLLDTLAAEPGFRKSLSGREAYDRLLRELDAGENPWAGIAARGGLDRSPYVAAVRPDASLLRRDREAKQARLQTEETRLLSAYGATDVQKALTRFRAETASATAALEALHESIPAPSFVRDPPLTLDDVETVEGTLPSGPRLLRTHFGATPFTDLHMVFDARGVAEADLELLPLLPAALTQAGAATSRGERLDYVRARERLRSEIHAFWADWSANPETGRFDLAFGASAAGPEEVDAAAEWLGNYLLRSGLGAGSRQRLVDLAREQIQSRRGIFQQEEEYWARDAAKAYAYQDDPLYMATHSPFTALRHLTRLRWRLEGPDAAAFAAHASTLTAVESALAKERPEVARLLEGIPGELGEMLRWELGRLPPDSWRSDLRRLLKETRHDLARDPRETIDRLVRLGRSLLVRGTLRTQASGSPAGTERAAAALDRLAARLPRGTRAAPPRRRALVTERLRDRYPGLGRSVHAALVNNDSKTGTNVVLARGTGYRAGGHGAFLDLLAAGILSGAGPHALFIQTWGAGLAYSNGLRNHPYSDQVMYYAERCPDLARTMRFAADIASRTAVNERLLEYSLAGAFDDYRGALDFSTRGAAIGREQADGVAPELVRAFKSGLLAAARAPGAVAAVSARLPAAAGRALVGYGVRVSADPKASAVVIGPEPLLDGYEAYLQSLGEAETLPHLYPRDFWP